MQDKRAHYTETLSYDLELTAKYCRALAIHAMEEFGKDMSIDELAALDVIDVNKDICQRDVAKLILKDRANTGRILTSLEEKGLIIRTNDTKNKRLVKKVKVSDKGIEKLKEISVKFDPARKLFKQVVTNEEIDNIRHRLKKIRDKISGVVNMQI